MAPDRGSGVLLKKYSEYRKVRGVDPDPAEAMWVFYYRCRGTLLGKQRKPVKDQGSLQA